MNSKKKIFVCPLDWGLGHATRCIPIIRELLNQNAQVIIGAEEDGLALLKNEFPGLPHIKFPGYRIDYGNGKLAWKMMRSIPKILRTIRKENQYIKEIIELHKINGVVSDNRYGLYTDLVPSIFITHQLFIQSPVGESLLHSITRKYTDKFNECWVPDFQSEEENLSGALSHGGKISINVKYVGPLSRFSNTTKRAEKYDVLAIISGPEPARSAFEELVINQLKGTQLSSLIALGKPQSQEEKTMGKITTKGHLNAKQLEEAILSSNVVIARPGYSTIMDLNRLGKKAILVPTPGQTEQEYLGRFHDHRGNAQMISQNKLNINEALNNMKSYPGFKEQPYDPTQLKKAVADFLQKC